MSPGIVIAIVAPMLTAVGAKFMSLGVPQPTAFLTVLALLFGGYLSAFIHYSSLRLRLTENEEQLTHAEAPERRLVDSAAVLLLAGAATSVIAVAAIAVLLSVWGDAESNQALAGWPAVAGWTISSIPVFLFVYTAPILFRGYTQIVATRAGAKYV